MLPSFTLALALALALPRFTLSSVLPSTNWLMERMIILNAVLAAWSTMARAEREVVSKVRRGVSTAPSPACYMQRVLNNCQTTIWPQVWQDPALKLNQTKGVGFGFELAPNRFKIVKVPDILYGVVCT
jgi:hypothetical protein